MSGITSEQARKAIEASLRKAEEISVPCSVAVVDAGCNLLAFTRMDDATLASIDIAQNKAYTARSLNMKTSALASLTQPGAELYGIETTCGRPLVVFGGGVPIERGGTVVGAVGVAGGRVEDDEAIAEAAAMAVQG